ncbi:MAG: hypothetical protein ACFFEF_08260 [Candidatus Thorarchaeota archaeon]
MLDYRRIAIATITGAILGVLCIIGVGARLEGQYAANMIFLSGMWYNRVIMGLVIGFAGDLVLIKNDSEKNLVNAIIRGLLFGVLISSAIYLSSEFKDFLSLLAGFAYGPIIDVVATATQKT